MIPDLVLGDLVETLRRSVRGIRAPGKHVRLTMTLDVGFPKGPPEAGAVISWRNYRHDWVTLMNLQEKGTSVRTLRLAFEDGRPTVD